MARGDQLSRQWKIIQSLMASHSGKTAAQLADALECHQRTTYRDLEALQGAGFPLCTEQRGGKTYWSMLDGDRHQMPLPLSLTELMALYFSRNMLAVLRGTAIHDSLTDLFEKVKATLPANYLAYLDKLEEAVHLQVFVTPTCPYCPQAVVLAHAMAIASDKVRADMVEATEFPQLSIKYNVMGVPRTVVNETEYLEGAAPEQMLIDKIQAAMG